MLLVCLCLGAADTADAARRKSRRAARPIPDRSAHIVVDAATGTIIAEKNATAPRYPASLTKMMTLYLTFEKIEEGRLRKNDRLEVSSHAAAQSPSKLGLRPGSTLRVEDGILALVTKSANDAAVVLAEGIGGSESRFAALMTQKARELGMKNTRFVNASGLHNPSQITTARDMALLSLALLRDFPREYRYFSTRSFTYGSIAHRNHNRLMETYDGMDGLKTGFVYASGYNLAASAVRGRHRLVGVVLGGNTAPARNKQMAQLLDAGFEHMQNHGAVAPTVVAENTTNTVVEEGDADIETDNDAAAVAATAPAAAVATKTATSTAQAQKKTPAASAQKSPKSANTQNRPDTEKKVTAKNLPQKSDSHADNAGGIAADTRIASLTAEARSRLAAQGVSGWGVQIGAFASHDAGVSALRRIQKSLPASIQAVGQPVIAPLMTSRGLIYRARLHNLTKDHAVSACRQIKENCLILAGE